MLFMRELLELFDWLLVNLGWIVGGDVLNKVFEECVMDVDICYLFEQDLGVLLV